MSIWRVSYPKFGSGIALHRVEAIAAQLGLDLAGFGANAAAITGSNGKGSTAAMTASILAQTGRPVGLFTSPHLFALNERFRIDGEDISDADLAAHWARVKGACDVYAAATGETVGGFEFLFLIAADWFAARSCAFTVWEAGIGGRFDPTRLIRAKRAALVSLDLEHTALLGATLEQIAYDKIDIAPPGATLFLGEGCGPLRAQIEAYCRLRDVAPVFVTTDTDAPLPGAHQRVNASLARRLAQDLASFDETHVAAGLAATRWPGRLEIIEREPLTVIDVGHTPDAIRVARAGFDELRGARAGVLVCGASIDKDAPAIIGSLAPGFAAIICAASRHKGRPAAEIAALASAANLGAEILVADEIHEARRLALAQARARNGAIYVAGGLFLAAEFKASHLGLDPAALAFF